MKLMNKKIVILIVFIMIIIIGRRFIFNEGYVYFAENFEVYDVQSFIQIFYPLWNEQLQEFNYNGIPKLYIFGFVAFVCNLLDSYKLLQIILIFSPYIIGYYSTYVLMDYLIDKHQFMNKEYKFYSSIFAGYIYIVNPWLIMFPLRIIVRIQYSFLPLITYVFIKMMDTMDKKYAIYFGIIMSIVGGYRYIVIVSFFISILSLCNLILTKYKNILIIKNKIKLIFISYILFLTLSIGKFLPSILFSFYNNIQAIDTFSYDQINRETMLHIFTTKIIEYTANGFDMVYSDKTHYFFIIVTIFSFMFLILNNFKIPIKYIYSPLITYILFMLFTSKEINVDFVLPYLPLSILFSRLLRHARWNIMPMILSVVMMSGYSLYSFFLKYKKKSYPLYVILILASSISVWPLFTGNMNGFWNPTKPPTDYININAYLDQTDSSHTLWLPETSRKAIWSEQVGAAWNSATMGTFTLRSSKTPSYNTWNLYFFDYYNVLNDGPGMSPLPHYKGDISTIYEPLNIKYIALHYDGGWTTGEIRRGFSNEYIKTVSLNLSQNDDINEIYRGEYLTALELDNDSTEFYCPAPAKIIGGLDTYGELFPLLNNTPGVVFQDQSDSMINFGDEIIFSDNENLYDLLYLTNRGIAVYPKKYLKYYDPYEVWSPSYVSDVVFQSFMESNNIDWSWQFDYGHGIIFSLNEKYGETNDKVIKGNIFCQVSESGNYKIFLRVFKNIAGGLIKITINDEEILVNTKDEINKFCWIELRNVYLEKGKNNILIENHDGFNSINAFNLIKIEDYNKLIDDVEVSLNSKKIIYAINPSKDLYKYNESYYYNKFNLLKNSTHKITFIGDGKYEIKVGNQKFNVSVHDKTSIYGVKLNKGECDFIIKPFHSNIMTDYLEEIIFYSDSDASNNVFHFLNNKSAYVISSEKISSSNYKLKINASEPYLLAFAEGYDPLWIAEVKTTDEIKSMKSIPLYGVINGFWIDVTGEYEISIRYLPNVWFKYSIFISIFSFITCLFYLFYYDKKIN